MNPDIFLSELGKRIEFPIYGMMSQCAEANGAELNATAGIALDENGNPFIYNSMSKLICMPSQNVVGYSGSFGESSLRDTWRNEILEKNSSINDSTVSKPVVTSGLTHGLSIAAQLLCNKGDTILLPSPTYENYNHIFSSLYELNITTFDLLNNDKFCWDNLLVKLESSRGSRRSLLLNFPCNPLGYTPTKNQVKELVHILKNEAEFGPIAVILDDAYFGLFYEEDTEKESIFSYLSNLSENLLAVKLDGATKEEFSWGLRVGFITFAAKELSKEKQIELEMKVAGLVRGSISNPTKIGQSLVEAAIVSGTREKEKKQILSIIKERYLESKRVLSESKWSTYWTVQPFNSGYFFCLKLKSNNSHEVRRRLMEKKKIAVVSPSENMIRVAFSAIKKESIEILIIELAGVIKELD